MHIEKLPYVIKNKKRFLLKSFTAFLEELSLS
jgi:hypothetical protein